MKKCPFCAEQIQDDAIKCRYCGSMLSGAVPPASPAAADAAPEVAQLLAAGRKIDAIRLVRQRTGAGLREAKDYVEAIEGGRTPSPLAVRPVLPAQPGAGRGGAIFFWLVLVAVGALLYWWMGSTR